ncbi:MAG: histidine ammonia-lyase [Candidatus Thermoplasmatota archaeon]
MEVCIDGNSLTIEDVVAVARGHALVAISEHAEARVRECAALVQRLVDEGKAIYGVTTGIGEFSRIMLSKADGEALQRKIIYSHSAGTGNPLSEDEVRASILLRANTLAKGNSGVRLSTLNTMLQMLNRNVVPIIYEKGSLGASGDLSPLSQMAEVIIGEGEALYKGRRMSGGEAMRAAGIAPVVLTFKEGLGLINGTQVITALGALSVHDAETLMKVAEIASAMSLDALRANVSSLDPRIHELRRFPGQIKVAEHLRRMLEGSEILSDPARKVQDAYSLRCVPQILGASRDAIGYVRRQIETEMNALSDNPIFVPEDGVHLSCGNFHGQYTAMSLDFLAIAVAEIADLSERHTNRLMNPALSGLPDFLVEGKGLNSGLMVAQYTAAALVSENKVLCHPAVVDSIPVSADQEDHVSMGNTAALKLREVVRNTGTVLAIEILSAVQALDFRAPVRPGKGVQPVHEAVRSAVPHLHEDRILHPDIEKLRRMVWDGTLIRAAEGAIGRLE